MQVRIFSNVIYYILSSPPFQFKQRSIISSSVVFRMVRTRFTATKSTFSFILKLVFHIESIVFWKLSKYNQQSRFSCNFVPEYEPKSQQLRIQLFKFLIKNSICFYKIVIKNCHMCQRSSGIKCRQIKMAIIIIMRWDSSYLIPCSYTQLTYTCS